MRIAQVAPLYEAVPPKLYGGTERVVAHLTNALVGRGHEVVLFASADSKTRARLIPCRDVALRLDEQLFKSQYTFSPTAKGGYLAFLGRISPEKGVDRAIEIAYRAGIPLHIAAKVDQADMDYFSSHIEPLLKTRGVEFVGEISESEKSQFLGGAIALLFPISWPEPFGLVMIEAMACGTPVIAFARGAVSEVIQHGVTGFIVETVDDAVKAIARLDTINRNSVRASFERRFSVDVMAANYELAYQSVLAMRNRVGPDVRVETEILQSPLQVAPEPSFGTP
jgi:glycosyltransferase involved in cell wall biosynthesis